MFHDILPIDVENLIYKFVYDDVMADLLNSTHNYYFKMNSKNTTLQLAKQYTVVKFNIKQHPFKIKLIEILTTNS